jgi:RNA polymerase sigma factor (sigma-70 family)
MDDWQLISEYAGRGSEKAFRELVERHLGLVHSVAVRTVGNPERAREVSQTVFILLARKAHTFRPSIVLSAWLFRTTRFVAARAVRSEARRLRREQEAFRMQEFQSPSEAVPHLAPVLDEALGELSESDRQALLIRFYEDRSLQQVATSLGVREEAAKKRVSRALERLRAAFSRRGFVVSTAIAGGVLSQNLAQAAPAGMAHAISSSALSLSIGTTPALVTEVLHAWRWAKLKLGFGVGVAIIATLLIVTTVVPESLRRTRVSNVAVDPNRATQPLTTSERATNVTASMPVARPFLFKVVDAETGAGIPGAEVHGRYWSSPGAIEPRDDLVTDAEGVCAVPLPDPSVGRLDVGVLATGYVQKFFTWFPDRFGPLPRTYELKLERGVGIGGVVRSHDGRPVADATITLSFPDAGESSAREPARERLGSFFGLPAARTDARGRWQCANVPPRYADFTIDVAHADFPARGFGVIQHGEPSTERVSLAALYAGDAVFTLAEAYSISGKVIDDLGQPVPDGKVSASRWADPRRPDAVTDAQGKFVIRKLREGSHPITVVADGFAPQKVNAETGESAVTIQLKRGSLLRLRVVEPSGEPVAAADVALESWGVDNKLQLRESTDADGRFEWRSAPPDVLEICVLKPGYAASRGHKLRASGEEHVITLKPSFRAVGRVVNADTGEPLAAFKAFPGYGSGYSILPQWDLSDVVYGRNGYYELPFEEARAPYSVRIMADGYEAVDSAPMTDEENPRTFDAQLHRARPDRAIKGVVFLPTGKPAAHTDVGVCTIEKSVMIGHWRISQSSRARPIKTDDEGRFEFPPDPNAHTLVAVSREGVARVGLKGPTDSLEIRLEPWGRIEGTVRLERAADREVLLFDHSRDHFQGGTSMGFDFKTKSDGHGRFVLDPAPPGDYSLFIDPGIGRPYSHRTPVTIKAGTTAQADIGGGVLTLQGRFELAGSTEGINWSNQIGLLQFQTNVRDPEPPSTVDRSNRLAVEQWKRDFWQSPEAQRIMRERKAILLEIAPDGTFTAENVQPGAYELFAHLYDRAIDNTRIGSRENATQIGHISRKKITVSEAADDTPIDLGTIQFQSLPPRAGSH